jgi:O-antigen/teichoic acid export membrane protein
MVTSAKDASLILAAPNEEVPPRLKALTLRLKHFFGVDRAIAFTVLARGIQILGSAGTVLLILRVLTADEQGYYYTLLGFVSLQMVFELGFSFVILQMAAHECAHLTLYADGHIEGEVVAHARLASILQKTLRWYLVAAAILCVSLLPVGVFFFSRHAQTMSLVSWQGPWVVAVLATGVLFLLNPFFSFLEGCGLVWQVGRMRFGQAVLGAAMSWGALLSHHGLYSPGMVTIGYVVVGAGFLWAWRNLLLTLLRYAVHEAAVSWRTEVWPFQWKIAVSWLCSYFTVQIFTPVLFAYRGPAEAGQFGLSLSITTYLSALVIAWMSTKATPFGQMIARGELHQLTGLFFRTLRQSLSVLVGISAACEAGVLALHYLFPRLAARMASPQIFVLLLLAAVSGFVVQSMAIYLRSFKREPFLVQSIVIAALSIVLALVTVRTFGTTGIAVSYFLCTGIVGMIFAATTFRSWHGAAEAHF